MYKPSKLQNASDYPNNPIPTIVITKDDEVWSEALQNYLSGKNPTDSPEWKKGIVCCFELVVSKG